MYPFLRMARAVAQARKMPKGDFFVEHRVTTRIMPWDIDIFGELNNGRWLTLYDLARFGLAVRVGLADEMRRTKTALPVIAASVRYRRRVTLWQKVSITARLIGHDERFYYILQDMDRDGQRVGQAVFRMGFAKNGLIAPRDFFSHLDIDLDNMPELPEWVRLWIASEDGRPWPKEEKS